MRSPTPIPQPPDREPLVAALRARGVGFYAPSDAGGGPHLLTGLELITGLAASPDPRLRDALVALFLRQPELSAEVARALRATDSAAAAVLHTQYTAAACLQRMWWTTLGMYRRAGPLLPDLFGVALGLPPLDDHFGEQALRELADRSPYNQLAAWHAVVDQLLAHLAQESRRELAAAG